MKGIRVLLAEDNDDHAEIYSTILVDFGVEVVRVRNGEDAIKLLKQEFSGEIDRTILLLDLKLPVLDGVGVISAIRMDRSLKGLNVVLLSSMELGYDIETARKLGVKEVVSKTSTLKEFVEVFQRVINNIKEKK